VVGRALAEKRMRRSRGGNPFSANSSGGPGVRSALLVLGFIFLYKLGDRACATAAGHAVLYLDMGFSKSGRRLDRKKRRGLVAEALIGRIARWWAVDAPRWPSTVDYGCSAWVQVVSILGFAWLSRIGPFGGNRRFRGEARRLRPRDSVRSAWASAFGRPGRRSWAYISARPPHPAYTATSLRYHESRPARNRAPFLNANDRMGWSRQLGWFGFSFFMLCVLLALPGDCCCCSKVAPVETEEKSAAR